MRIIGILFLGALAILLLFFGLVFSSAGIVQTDIPDEAARGINSVGNIFLIFHGVILGGLFWK